MYYHPGQWLENGEFRPADVLSFWSVARKPRVCPADVLSSWSVARKPRVSSRRCINYQPGQWLENREFRLGDVLSSWSVARKPRVSSRRCINYHPGQWLENREFRPGDVLIIILVSD